jgi:DNA-directed RNA polymerase specialized sigma24 family protein
MSTYSPPVSDRLIQFLANKYAKDWQHGEDLFQEGQITVWQTYQRNPGQSPSYYAAAAKNRIHNVAARRIPYTGAPQRNGPSVYETGLDPTLTLENKPVDASTEPSRAYVDDELLRSYPHLVLWASYGFTFKEVAEVLNESVKFARNRIESERAAYKAEYEGTL